MQRYQAYDDLKSSGIKWLGDVPTHWETLQGHRLFGERKERMRPDDEMLTASQKYGVIPQAEFMRREDQKVMQVYLNAEILKHVEPDDFVISMRSFQGGLEFCAYSGCVSSAYVGIFALKHVEPAFFKYLFKSSPYIQALQRTSNLVRDGQALRFQNFSMVRLPVIPKDEQKQIASFLDYETAKIDALIEKQQQLIALLGEKRQAVISHAVTKGLNPDAPMRDSGVEWLGEVPSHWNLKQLRNVSTQLGGGTPSKDNASFWDGDIPWVSPKDMKVDYISTAQDKITEAAVRYSSAKLIPVGSVLIVVRGMILDHSVPTALTQKPLTVNQDMKAVLPGRDLNGEFLLFFFNGMRDYLLSHTYSSAHGTKVMSVEKLERTFIALPDLEEQSELVAQLKERLARLDVLIAKSNGAMELLHERRTALISAAVTGKIDVRGWKRPSAAPKKETEMEVA